MTNENIYCTYVTFYSGNKLPPFYIGSSSVAKVEAGYNGSVRSKKWKDAYITEQRTNKHLFTTEIIATFETREDATAYELDLQKSNDAVRSKWFFNESYASKNGFFGRDVSGANNPTYGKSGLTKAAWEKKSEEELKLLVDARKKTYKKRTGFDNHMVDPSVIQSREASYTEKTGYPTPFHDPRVHEKQRETLLANYGVDNPMRSEEIRSAMADRMEEKTGYRNTFSNPETIKKMRDEYEAKTGYRTALSNPAAREMGRLAYLERTGYDHFSRDPIVSTKKKEAAQRKKERPLVKLIEKKIEGKHFRLFGLPNNWKLLRDENLEELFRKSF